MGWFWATPYDARALQTKPPHPTPSSSSSSSSSPSNATPPPGCPMHKAPAAAPAPTQITKPTSDGSACPYVPPETPSSSSPNATTSTTTATSPPANITTLQKLNPLNYMPANLSNKKADSQKISLPLSRETSSIPKGDGTGANWEYPSPQQMYNAMLRKGYTDTPEDAVEAMVSVHNFLNEGAWAEILEWERRFGQGLSKGWELSKQGEEGTYYSAMSEVVWQEPNAPAPQLIRFMGRPTEMTPKAAVLQALGKVWPAKYGGEAPFDRHDWFVRRSVGKGKTEEVRYVIDYYSGEPEPTGEPVFYLDVRPAVDSPNAAAARLMRWGGDLWYRGTGGSGVRQAVEEARAQAKAEGRA